MLYAKFRRASLIRKCFKVGKTESLTKKPQKTVMVFSASGADFDIYQNRGKTQVFIITILLRKIYTMLHWKALQIEIEKCHLASDSCQIYTPSAKTPRFYLWVFFEKIGAGTAFTVAR